MKITVLKRGRTFECYPSAECSGKMCSVNVWEVKRPRWKIFRTSYFGNRCFWIDDYESIQEGIEDIVGWLIRQEERDHERTEKCAHWKNLEMRRKEKIKMKYYKITTTTIFCGTDNEHYIASQEPMSEEELRETAEELARENAESFEYLLTGWNDENIEDFSEDEIQELLDNYYADCSYEYEEISKEEYEENMGAE